MTSNFFNIIQVGDKNLHVRYAVGDISYDPSAYESRMGHTINSISTDIDYTLWMINGKNSAVIDHVLIDTKKLNKQQDRYTRGRKGKIYIVRKGRGEFSPEGIARFFISSEQYSSEISALIELAKNHSTVDELVKELQFLTKRGHTRVYKFIPLSIKQRNPLMIFFVTWMREYQGITPDDKPYGGGSHIDETEKCGELWNFVDVNGYCYGYGMTRHNKSQHEFSGVDLERLLPGKTWEKEDVGKGIDIVYIANNTSGEHCVVGWHKDADVFHKYYDEELLKHLRDNTDYGYLSKTKTENAKLVEESERQPIPKRLWERGQTRHMYPDARPELTEWLYRYINNSIETAKAESDIAADPNLSPTEKEQLTKSRKGQGKFRADVLKHRNYRCVLTDIETEELLIASHIKPWAKSDNRQRLDPHNGLLLAATHDKLFDQGYITFDENGTLQISSELSAADREKLFQKENIQCDFSSATLEYLKHHRDNIFKP